MFDCTNLDEFLSEYGDLLAETARETLSPLHVPSRDKPDLPEFYRTPFEPQAHVMEAMAKQWKRAKPVCLVAEMGTGKTFMSMGSVHAYMTRKASDTEMGRRVTWTSDSSSVEDEYEVVDVDPWTMQSMMKATAFDHNNKKRSAKTFTYGGSEWTSKGGSHLGTPGSSTGYRLESVCFQVCHRHEWPGATASNEDVYHVANNPDREKKIRRVIMGGLGIECVYKGKPGVLHSPKRFRSLCPRAYRVAVVCPGQLTEKWTREIVNTVPGAIVYQVESYAQILKLAKGHARYKEERKNQERLKKKFHEAKAKIAASGEEPCYPESLNQYHNEHVNGPQLHTRNAARCKAGHLPMGCEYYVIGRDCLKLSCGWKPVYRKRPNRPGCYCPKCGQSIKKTSGGEEINVGDDYFIKNGKPTSRRKCGNYVRDRHDKMVLCGEQLWQEVKKPAKYSPAKLIHKKLKGFFDVGVIDEAHEYKGDDSLQGDAVGAIARSCNKVAALTGTLVGGYAWHVRTLLYRIGGAKSLIQEGLGWKDEMEFNRRFGRIETKTTTSANAEAEVTHGHALGRGGKKASKSVSYVRPGIMPTLFKHLMGCCVFLGLAEVAQNLPHYSEEPLPSTMDDEQADAYEMVEKALTTAIKDLARKGNKAMLGVMLNCLLCYPDYAYDWGEIGYWETDEDSISGEKVWVHVVTPPNLDPQKIRPKEQDAVNYALSQASQGRQVWVYCCYTDKRDCIARLERFLKQAGLKVGVMRSSVKPVDRERWIEENGNKYQVILSHPQLVQTGLDFFSPTGGHNYCSILFYQTGYNPFTLAQAARRAWRIGQTKVCEVRSLYYENSMQARAMALMGKKMMAMRNLNGQFSAEGLAAMAGEDAGLEMEMAKSIAEAMPESDQIRSWAKVHSGRLSTRAIVRDDDLPDADTPLPAFQEEMFDEMDTSWMDSLEPMETFVE